MAPQGDVQGPVQEVRLKKARPNGNAAGVSPAVRRFCGALGHRRGSLAGCAV